MAPIHDEIRNEEATRRAKLVSKALWTAVALFLVIVAIPIRSAFAQTNWRGLSPRDLPARVTAIRGLPHTLDPQNCVNWGRWRACFGSQFPVAKYVQLKDPPALAPWIVIENLNCENPVAGAMECSMRLIHFYDPLSNRSVEVCWLLIGRGAEKEDNRFQISCPRDLVLK